jgi:GntR family transcriptional regulator
MAQKSAERLSETYERSRTPRYVQVAATLRRRIELGEWQPGDKISTLEELEAEFQVARVTVRQAVEMLQEEGLVIRRQGKGTFVISRPVDQRWLKLETDWEALVDSIRDNEPHALPVEGAPPRPRLTSRDGTAADEYAFLKSLQMREGEPYALAQIHLAKEIYERHPKSFRRRTALSVLASLDEITIARAYQTFVIGAADIETAQRLGLALNAPTAEAHCVVVDDRGVAIYVGDIIYRGDRVKFDIDLLNTGHS